MNVRDKIKERLDQVEVELQAGRHLAGAEGQSEMVTLLNSASKFFTVMDDGERDFVNSARIVIEEGTPWV